MDSYGGYLGILKWSLAQSDGTKPSEVKPMSAEVRLVVFFSNCRIVSFSKKLSKKQVFRMLLA